MRTSVLVRMSALVAGAALGASLLVVAPAHADEPAPPLVVPDTLTMWPGQGTIIDVLANDTSPSGDDLALCRFPEPDIFTEKLPSVMVMQSPGILPDSTGGPGELLVGLAPRARGTHVIDYYVCDHTHLVPATLTVVVREVQPVDVTKVRGKRGRLKVTNHNDRPVRVWYGHPRAIRPDGKLRVPAGATRTIRVQRHKIMWAAMIGGSSGKASLLSSPGIADHGVVKHIKLKGEPLPKPKKSELDDLVDLLGRWGA